MGNQQLFNVLFAIVGVLGGWWSQLATVTVYATKRLWPWNARTSAANSASKEAA